MDSPGDSLVDRISRFIEAEQFSAGERIGSERALAEQFAVSRSELRTALELLERHHRIRRTIGRSGGVFCWDGKIERHLNTIEGVPDMLRQQGFRATTTVLHSGIAIATPVECRALRIARGEPVFRLLRRRDADDIPLSLDSMTLPIRMLPGFQNVTHTQSVYRTLLEEYEIEAAQANETIDVSAANTEQAEVLRISVGDPLLDIRRVTYSQHGVPFEFAHDYFVAARTRITLSRHGARWKRAAEPARRRPHA
ncbi:GntR family transcriptional regulator [Microbacterium sp. SORGH_AS_0862]|uniref:GntR family transcriptional regulator n=1 Tax=Microbacterium sp. SORGH_AS_0862 TaxID=3041789 RepID=UPI002791DB81|nr:GntR family transcriptional regulator [Microbacterium sp. SORGH_AS_0862]MDQ1205351.1 GntR family transcriptional regulator [Microbacterium sp. SORGH_AS_0862]